MYFQVTDRGINKGQVKATADAQERVWVEWTAFYKSYQVCPRLNGEDFEAVTRMATGFGGKIRCGNQMAGQVGAGMTQAGLEGIAKMIATNTGQQPLH